MKIRTCLLASLIFSGITATKVDASTDLNVCTRTPNGTVNVRSGPGTNYRVASRVFNGQTLRYHYEGMQTNPNAKPPMDRYGYYWVEVSSTNYEPLGYLRSDFLGCSPSSLQQWFNKNL